MRKIITLGWFVCLTVSIVTTHKAADLENLLYNSACRERLQIQGARGLPRRRRTRQVCRLITGETRPT